jgi:hypothetical protein
MPRSPMIKNYKNYKKIFDHQKINFELIKKNIKKFFPILHDFTVKNSKIVLFFNLTLKYST